MYLYQQEEMKTMVCTNVQKMAAIEHSYQLMEEDDIFNVYIKLEKMQELPVSMAVEKRTPLTKWLHYKEEHVNETRTGK